NKVKRMPSGKRLQADSTRRLTALELFILAAVRQGLATPYELNTKAELSVGTSVPVLKRLRKEALLSVERAPRSSLRYSLTSAGARALEESWRSLLDSVPTDFQAVLRVAYTVLVVGESPEVVKRYLSQAAKERQQLCEGKRRAANFLAKSSGSFGLYRRLK